VCFISGSYGLEFESDHPGPLLAERSFDSNMSSRARRVFPGSSLPAEPVLQLRCAGCAALHGSIGLVTRL